MTEARLQPLENYTEFPGPVACIVLDGIGIGRRDESDGVYLANTPVLDALMASPMATRIKAHGEAVGMPSDDDMGNSEVGHNTLGAGRVFPQGAKRVHLAIEDGSLFEGKVWEGVLTRARHGGTVHLLGLLSDGNVHSHIDHVIRMLEECAADGVASVRVHILLDGRDVGERTALGYIEKLEQALYELSSEGRDYRIASGGGRMTTTMDRYQADWKMVERGWHAHVLGDARPFASAAEAVQTFYDEDSEVTDQYLGSFTIVDDDGPVGRIADGDAVVCFNFRGDRVIEISRAFEEDRFSAFERVRWPEVFFAGMTLYDGDLGIPSRFLVESVRIDRSMSEYLCAEGVTSLAISETQKYGHVTYFWNGNKSGYVDETLERYVEVPSDNVPFEQRPWMKAAEVTDETIAAVESGDCKFIRINYANGDMVGHTGNPDAVRIAVEAVDLVLGRLLDAIRDAKGVALVLSDHGNAELMFTEKDGKREPHVSHTLNPVPCVIADYANANAFRLKPEGAIAVPGLSNIAATLFNLLGYEAPPDYDPSLIELS